MMDLGPRLQLTQQLRCSVCKQSILDREQIGTAVVAGLFGFAPYAVCSNCGQQVSKPWSKSYKARWTKKMEEKKTDMHFVLVVATDRKVDRAMLRKILIQAANDLNDADVNEKQLEIDSEIVGKWRIKENE